MGLLKAIIAISIAVIVSNIIKQFVEKNKEKPFIKYIKQYTDTTCYLMLTIIILIMIIL